MRHGLFLICRLLNRCSVKNAHDFGEVRVELFADVKESLREFLLDALSRNLEEDKFEQVVDAGELAQHLHKLGVQEHHLLQQAKCD